MAIAEQTESKPEQPDVTPEAESDDEAAEQKADGEEGAPRTRKERKQAWKRAQDELAEVRAAAKTMEDQIARMREEHAELRGRLAAREEQTKVERADPRDRELELINEEMDAEEKLMQDGKRGSRHWRSLADRRAEILAEKVVDERMARLPRGGGSDDAIRASLEADFDWLPHNDKARNWAAGREQQLIAEGRPAGIATMRAALAEAAVKFKLGGSPNGDDRSLASRYSGSPSRNGEATSSQGDDDAMKVDEQSEALIRANAQHRGVSYEKALKDYQKALAR